MNAVAESGRLVRRIYTDRESSCERLRVRTNNMSDAIDGLFCVRSFDVKALSYATRMIPSQRPDYLHCTTIPFLPESS
jgi:hypothetical protein